jgi:AcrR family transcriptional regulator
MNGMVSRQPSGGRERTAQKRRTRAALLDAARDLLAGGAAPSVSEVADAAQVSRATAYRYFPTQDALLSEAAIDDEPLAPTVVLGEDAPDDPEDRMALVQHALYDVARSQEAEFRVFLRASVARSGDGAGDTEPVRGARRADLIREALAPLEGELDPDLLERLRTSLAPLVGIESLVVLRDVLGLDHEQARASGEWAVRGLVRAARAGVLA